jgi:hypothetical protein
VCADAIPIRPTASSHTGNLHPDGVTGAFYIGVSGYAKSDAGFSYVELRFLNASALGSYGAARKIMHIFAT